MPDPPELIALPDNLLLRVLNHLPGHCLLGCRSISKHFQTLVETARLERRQLILYGDTAIGETYFTSQMYDFYDLSSDQIDFYLGSEDFTSSPGLNLPLHSEVVPHQLVRLFPNITHLRIINNSYTNYWPARLISLWPQTVQVTLLNPFITLESWSQVPESLSKLAHLQSLSLCCTADQFFSLACTDLARSLVDLSLTIFRLIDLPRILQEVVSKRFTNLVTFGFRSADVSTSIRKVVPIPKNTSRIRITRLALSIRSIADLQVIVGQWGRDLEDLELTLAQVNETDTVPAILEILTELMSLGALTKLTLALSPAYQTNIRLFQPDEGEGAWPQLPTVTHVIFKMVLDPHSLLVLESCFPAVETIHVRIFFNYVHDLGLEEIFCEEYCRPILEQRIAEATEYAIEHQPQVLHFELSHGIVRVCH